LNNNNNKWYKKHLNNIIGTFTNSLNGILNVTLNRREITQINKTIKIFLRRPTYRK